MRTARWLSVGVTAVASMALLAACGNETTTEGSATATTSVSSSTSRASATSAVTGTKTPQGSASKLPEETVAPASEYNAAPQPATKEQSSYLEALTKAGIDVTKTDQEQLIATGRQYCSSGQEEIIVNAVAGQLVEQGAASGDPAQVAQRLTQAAKDHLCR